MLTLKETRVKNTTRKMFSQQDLEYLVMHHKTCTTIHMAKALGFSIFLIYMKLRDYGMKPYSPPRKFQSNQHSNAKVAEVMEDYCTTFDPMTVIGDRHNVSVYTITQWITKHILPKKQSETTEVITLKSKV